MIKGILLSVSLVANIFATSVDEITNNETNKFYIYKKNIESSFQNYKKEQEKAFTNYKKELNKLWENPKLSTRKTWISYTPDKKTRSDVDFEKETITIETIASSPQEAKQKLQIALAKVITINNQTVQKTDPLEKILSKIRKPAGIVSDTVKPEPILATVVFKKPPTKKSVREYVNKHVSNEQIKIETSKKVKHAKIYSVKVQLPQNSMVKRSRIYLNEVRKQAKVQKIPLSLIFAIMHSESSFNPRARSHIPAFGLMQIVPKSAGIDTYLYLYKKKKLVTGEYLYNSTNNIKMGAGYLHILYYSYLKRIENSDSRMYCTIAAYNTGAGNIAFAFNRYKNLTRKQKFSMKRAAEDINALTPDEVYSKLLKDLKWDEPKHYLKKVSKRMSAYHKIYGV